MAHQINLYNPILLAPRRHFSAQAMAQAMGVLALGLAVLGAWTAYSTTRLQRALASASALQASERQRLQATLDASGRALPADTAALEQELARERAAIDERRARLAELKRGLIEDGRAPSVLLRQLAQSVPEPIWLRELRYEDGRLELEGYTLQPEALRPWLATLARSPVAAAHPPVLVSVERSAGAPGFAGASWSFRAAPAPDTLAAAATSAAKEAIR